MKSAVLDKDLVGMSTRDDDAGEEDTFSYAFQRFGVERGLLGGGVEEDSVVVEESEIGAVADHGEDEIVLDGDNARGRRKDDGIGTNFDYVGVEVRLYFSGGDAIFDVGLDPVFDVLVDGGATVNHGDAGTGPEEFEGCDGGGIFGTDDEDVVVIEGVGFAVVMLDFGEVFTGDAEHVGNIVIAGGEDDFAGAIALVASEPVCGGDGELAVGAVDGLDAFVLMDVEFIVIGDATVVLQGFGAGGFFGEAGHGDVTDLEEFGSGEKRHVGGVIVKRIGEAAFVYDEHIEPVALEVDCAGEPRGTRSYNEDVVNMLLGHNLLSISAAMAVRACWS